MNSSKLDGFIFEQEVVIALEPLIKNKYVVYFLFNRNGKTIIFEAELKQEGAFVILATYVCSELLPRDLKRIEEVTKVMSCTKVNIKSISETKFMGPLMSTDGLNIDLSLPDVEQKLVSNLKDSVTGNLIVFELLING